MKISGDCAKFFEHVSDFVDGSLPATEKAALEKHLEGCRACLHYAESLTALKECLKNGCSDCAGVTGIVEDCVKKFLSNK